MTPDVSLTTLDRDAAIAAADELAAVYARAFGAPGYDEPPDAAERFRIEQLPRHADRDGFRCVVARSSGRVVGFAYGYTGERGQWRSDRVAASAPAGIVDRWLGGHFEFVKLAADPARQGRASARHCTTRCWRGCRTAAPS